MTPDRLPLHQSRDHQRARDRVIGQRLQPARTRAGGGGLSSQRAAEGLIPRTLPDLSQALGCIAQREAVITGIENGAMPARIAVHAPTYISVMARHTTGLCSF